MENLSNFTTSLDLNSGPPNPDSASSSSIIFHSHGALHAPGKLSWPTILSFGPSTLLSPASPDPRQVRSQLNAYLRVLLGPREAREGTMARWNGHGGLRGPQGSEAWSGSPAGGRLLASCTSAATAAET